MLESLGRNVGKGLGVIVFIMVGLTACNKNNEPTTEMTGDELLAEVRASMSRTIASSADDQAVTELTQRVISEGLLVGQTTAEIEAKLGPSLPCGDGGWCTFFELRASDRYYEVGTVGDGFAGGTPMLLLGFDENGRCNHAQLAHGQ